MIFKKLYSNINLAYIVFFIVVPEYWLSAHLGIGIFACGAWLHFWAYHGVGVGVRAACGGGTQEDKGAVTVVSVPAQDEEQSPEQEHEAEAESTA